MSRRLATFRSVRGNRRDQNFIHSSNQYAQTRGELDCWFAALAPGGMIALDGVSEFAAGLDLTGKGGSRRAFDRWRRWKKIPAFCLVFPPLTLLAQHQPDSADYGLAFAIKNARGNVVH